MPGHPPASVSRRTFLSMAAAAATAAPAGRRTIEIPAAVLEDKIHGGLLGQLLGDLNGLRHEMKYITEPGDVREYTPALPEGAWTDDDTDVEWPYLIEIQRTGQLLLPPSLISAVWKRHINRRIWCSHLYLRQIMDLGIDPPLTGRAAINPWAEFNLSGQFVAESWGLISPCMPQTAARIGLHYTHASVEGEAVQSTQMLDAMIATAFQTGHIEEILDAGAAALDPRSTLARIMTDVRQWHRENPTDWRMTRRLTKDKFCLYGGQDMRDRNGVWLNGASTIAALLYGGGDFVQTLRHAFNFGWDADNNAAACGTILGVIQGRRWLTSQGWNIQDLYRNTSRDQMPANETISTFGERLVAIARQNIQARGGFYRAGSVCRIAAEPARNIELLSDQQAAAVALRAEMRPVVEADVAAADRAEQERARAVYLAICLDLAPALKVSDSRAWTRAVSALAQYPRVLQVIFFEAPFPAGDRLREKALAAGLRRPAASIKLWA